MPLVTNVAEMQPFNLGYVYDKTTPNYTPLYKLLFPESTVEDLMGDTITLQQTQRGFRMAPMSTYKKKASTSKRQRTDTERTVRAPYIDRSRELSENDFYTDRVVGDFVFQNGMGDRYTKRLQDQIKRDVEDLKEEINLRKEWLTSQILQGVTTYTDPEDGTEIVIDYEKPAGNSITLTAGRAWDTTTGTPKPLLDLGEIDKLAVGHGILVPDFAILGAEASEAFKLYLHDGDDNVTKSQVRMSVLNANSELGNILQANGLLRLGSLGGKEMWGDYRTFTNDAGDSDKYIRTDYVEFFNAQDFIRTAREFRAPIRDVMFDAFGKDQNVHSEGELPEGMMPANNSSYLRVYSETNPSSLEMVVSERPLLWQEDGRKMFSLKVTNVV